ncbi:isoprenoid synthase domain-containing protein [Plectosphaerella cucumerina]|uniref:Terpene synthase n=1 Tax=Plectosphaerella cucumerina TaxID=40658 RepID=A0A8K0X229_9PEZI|nr:isoprenoid synthase domain-containing protein [Plectosphaerella cucumerina]
MATTNEIPATNGDTVAPTLTAAEIMINDLKGKVIRIPDLTTIFRDWPVNHVNQHYDELRPYVEEMIFEMELNDEAREDYLKQDLTWFIAVWFPYVSLDKLKILTLHVLWLFIWDDRVDIGEGDLAMDIESANRARANTAKIWHNNLWGADEIDWEGVEVDCVDAVIEPLAEGLRPQFGFAVRFLDSIEDYINSCETEQAMRIEGRVPSYDEYIEMRLDTSAVHTLCALAEYVTGETLPSEWFGPETIIEKIWKATNMGVILINDPISLKKELKTNCVINAVASLHQDTGGWLAVQDAIDTIVEKLVETVKQLDQDLEDARANFTEDEYAKLIRYANACKQMVIGTLYFSLRSSRYAVSVGEEDNSLEITL